MYFCDKTLSEGCSENADCGELKKNSRKIKKYKKKNKK